MKRTIAMLLALILALGLAGCGGGAKTQPQTDAAETPDYETAELKNDACSVTVGVGSVSDGETVFTLKLDNSAESLVTFIVDAVGFNGVSLFSETFTAMELVEAGASADSTVTVDAATLAEYGVGAIASADFSVVAIDAGGQTVLEDTLHYALSDDAPVVPAEPERAQTIVDQDGVRVSIGSGHVDSFGDYAVLLRCENTTDADVQVTLEQFRYNGHEADEYSLFIIPAGSAGYAKIWISADVLALMELSVDELTELDFRLKAEQVELQTVLAETDVTYALEG